VDLLLDGYWSMRDFDDSTLRLVEPLRAMRMIYFLAWCARQSEDYSFREHFPDWGSDSFWMAEIADLESQASAIREADASWVGGGQARDVYVGRVLTDH
jgi:Ser/Thr protein kinase RdoA (MazF antagonist)